MTLLGRVALGAGLILFGVGCFFEPREPEAGGGPVCFEKITQESELNVFANLNGAFRCRQAQTYLEQFTEDFEYVAPPSVQAQNPGISDWNFEDETNFVNLLFTASTDTIFSDVYNESEPPQVGTEVVFEGEYSITVVGSDGSEQVYSGSAIYTMRQERAIWLISRWVEEESNRPLGELRAALVP